MSKPPQELVEPYFTIDGFSYEGKPRRLIVSPVPGHESTKFETSIVDKSGKVMGAATLYIDEFVAAIPEFPELKRAFVNAVRFGWRS